MRVRIDLDSMLETVVPPEECVELATGKQVLDCSGQITVLWQPEEGGDEEAYKIIIKEGKGES